MPKPLPSQALLSERYFYSPVSGELISLRTGSPVGFRDAHGYLRVKVMGKKYGVHRIIWRLVTGQDPGSLIVDHWDDDRQNNSWHNLSLLTPGENTYKSRCGTARLVHPINAPFRCDG